MREKVRTGGAPRTVASMDDSERAARAAVGIFVESIHRLVEAGATKGAENAPRLFFPNGIELIRFTFKVASEVEISLTIAGEKAPKEPGATEHISSVADA